MELSSVIISAGPFTMPTHLTDKQGATAKKETVKMAGAAKPAVVTRKDGPFQKVARYLRILERVPDPLLAEGVCKLIKEAEAERAALHPEQHHK